MRPRLRTPPVAPDQGRERSPAPGTSARRSGAPAAAGLAFGSGGRGDLGAGAGRGAGWRRRLAGVGCSPAAWRMASDSFFSASRVWSGMMLVFFCAACATCACASPGSVRLSSLQPLLLGHLVGMRGQAGNGRDGAVVLVRHRHVGVPSLRRQAAAGDAGHRAEVVVADPHARHQRAGEADEPGIAIARTGAGLAGDGARSRGPRAWPVPSVTTAASSGSCARPPCRLTTCGGSGSSRSRL